MRRGQNVEEKPRKNEELRKWEDVLPRLKKVCIGKSVEIVQGKDRSRVSRIPLQGSPGFDKRNERRNRGVLGEGGAEWASGRNKSAHRCSS